MPRKPDERIDKARELFLQGMKLVEIANRLNLPEGTVRRWKSTHNWESERSDKVSERSERKKGAQPDNHNAAGHGAPEQNKNAEKHGFFSRYLPEETFSIIQEIEQKNPLDILWENIQIAYAAIVRSQSIMHVTEKGEMIKELKKSKAKITEEETAYEFQFAWDRQATFLKAQARAQGELRSLIRQYDELLHKNWDMATEEQRARIAILKAKAQGGEPETDMDDGFIDALAEHIEEDWNAESDV